MAERTVTPRYIPLGEAADYLGFSERSLRRYIAEGRLPAYRLGPRQLRFKRADLDALVTRVPTAGGDDAA